MKFTDFQKYKHDTIGKFAILKEMIESLEEGDLKTKDSQEILEAANEAFEKMLASSQEFLIKIKN
ncbi:hypothetical protein DOM21_10820 [Bacteriovorax stolpii]|uniref:Uncharacterized protein n=1 Tax=Bacteriovorax stolpii TaxID=960 RepID=A0A2K9NRG2_BACTC|nr:hypothetical protein [Bacteriovorax stolpii]AUN98091.1 hypothetical protein C0V70_08205 [Bacteriovorax stolpii]QDK41929.1 hypothetical protein DOM21_10820 [Bacteriovorax stolpii]TDP52005.1 hypothetical protein C8D79_2651 [Bacteriovorax stolpii]